MAEEAALNPSCPGANAQLSITEPTRNRGGLLDIVAKRDDLLRPHVNVTTVGFSDDQLLHWTTELESSIEYISTLTTR